jgi:hypothetical protein
MGATYYERETKATRMIARVARIDERKNGDHLTRRKRMKNVQNCTKMQFYLK